MARRSSVDFKLRGVLRRIGNNMDSELRPAMVQAANMVLATQQELMPVDEGDAKEALTAFISKSGLDAQIGVRGKRKNQKVFYVVFIERGVKAHQRGGKPVSARMAHPWLRPSIDLHRDDIATLIRSAIQGTLAKAASGGD